MGRHQVDNFKGGEYPTTLVIDDQGAAIAGVSRASGENEVLFRAGDKFQVTGFRKEERQGYIYIKQIHSARTLPTGVRTVASRRQIASQLVEDLKNDLDDGTMLMPGSDAKAFYDKAVKAVGKEHYKKALTKEFDKLLTVGGDQAELLEDAIHVQLDYLKTGG